MQPGPNPGHNTIIPFWFAPFLPVPVVLHNNNDYRTCWGRLKDRPSPQGLVVAQRSVQGWKYQQFAALGEHWMRVVPCCSCFQERRALCKAALIIGQKRLSDRTEMLKNPLESSTFADYNELGFNLRSNIFQGEGMHVPVPDLQAGSTCAAPGLTAAVLVWIEVWLWVTLTSLLTPPSTVTPRLWCSRRRKPEPPFLHVLSLSLLFFHYFFWNTKSKGVSWPLSSMCRAV